MSDNDFLWQTKLAARLHDPAEKALVLLRDPAGHENGTSRALKRLLGLDRLHETIDPDNDEVLARVLFKKGLPVSIYRHVQRADWWAAAADRPQWPMEEITVKTRAGEERTFAVASWAQVRWTEKPVLIHPLTGKTFNLGQYGGLTDTDIADLKQRSFEHFSGLLKTLGIQDAEPTPDHWRKVLLAFWRFGPELVDEEDHGKLGALWKQLPADTRVPDHSIWDHLDLTSAFAGAFVADAHGEAALLAMSIGPVQPFIAAARTTSDLWAGSHLLSRLAWETMRPACEALGPDAILFPRLRGVPQVDLWLRDQMELPDELFKDCEWTQSASDSNPLFSAALPNRFVAVVPKSQARELAEQAQTSVRQWLKQLGQDVVSRLLHAAGFDTETPTPYEQMQAQLEGFPEVHWAIVPFSLVRPRDTERQTDLDTIELSRAMAPFFGVEPGQTCGFLDSEAWKVLQGQGHDYRFFAPNPGVLYPAVHDLAERMLAAAKAVRPFAQSEQHGWRCTLTGEAEWLTHDRALLTVPAGKRRSRKDTRGFDEREHVETLWTRIADARKSWAKQGEHLAALPAIKRLWPTIFAEEVGKALAAGEKGEQKPIGRFVVSTHTMALAHQLDRWLEQGGQATNDAKEKLDRAESVALPRRLIKRHWSKPAALAHARRLPGLLEDADESRESELEANERLVRQILGVKRLETYYSLILMDGDRMGQILSGDERYAIPYRESFHPQVRDGFDRLASQNEALRAYGAQRRALSPGRHLAISAALNDFSLTVVRHVVEEEHLGRVIYAGGDDVLAMLPVADLLSCIGRLRHAYSGHDPEHEGGRHHGLTLQNGFAALSVGEGKNQTLKALMRMMGETATASCGAVIAHHQAPLAAVLRELRSAEARAKREGGRDAFSITVIKRSGGVLYLTAKWGEPLKLLIALRDFLAADDVSRRAVYHTHAWLRDLPEPEGEGRMLAELLAYQLARQAQADAKREAKGLAERLTALALRQPKNRREWLANFLSVAEFLARETRAFSPETTEQKERAA